MQKGAKARGKKRRLLSALPGCKTSNIFSQSKVSSSTLSVRLTLWYKFLRITFFRFYLCHLHDGSLGLLRPSLLWDWNRLSCKRLPWLWPRLWALRQGLCQLCHRSYHCWSRYAFFVSYCIKILIFSNSQGLGGVLAGMLLSCYLRPKFEWIDPFICGASLLIRCFHAFWALNQLSTFFFLLIFEVINSFLFCWSLKQSSLFSPAYLSLLWLCS